MPDFQCAALQLYTVRDLTAKNFAGTMKKVAEIGYQYVELAGYGNLADAKAVRKALDDAALKACSGHYSLDLLENKIEQVKDDAETLGIDTVVCPFLPEDRRRDAKGYEAVAKVLEAAGNQLHQFGVILAYHNHNFEFQKFGGKTGLDIIYENTPPHLVAAEIDVYWVKNAGVDPVEQINKLGDRVRLLHLKDMSPGSEKRFAPVGTGVIDFKAILAAAEKNGVRWGIVEQDRTYDATPLQAIKTSLDNLKKLGAV
jgi:sugar phosphate isomerase/epimerase